MKNTKNILIEKLHAFENHPYKVQDNEEMERLSESIREHGVLSPIIVRPKENGGQYRNPYLQRICTVTGIGGKRLADNGI